MHFEAARPLNVTLLASLCLHAALLGSLMWLGLGPAAAPGVRVQPAWVASGVEVGLVPTAPPEAPAAPTSPPEPPSPSPNPNPNPNPRISAPPRPAVERAAQHTAPANPPAGSSSVASQSSSPSPEPESSAPAGSLGALGLPPGVQHFARAFSWALPEGGHRDRAWSELPLGAVGKAAIDVTIDEGGRIQSVEFDPEVPPPPALKRMIDHAVFLLRPRRFSLDAKAVDVGVERLTIDVTLSQEAPHEGGEENPLGLASEGHKPPEATRPGYARFTLNSGRHLEAVLTREPRR